MPGKERPCECGCGGTVSGYSYKLKKPNMFIHGHNRRDIKMSDEQKEKIGKANSGRPSWVSGMGGDDAQREASKYNNDKRWTRNLFTELRKGAGFKCEDCGVTHKENPKKIHVHHKDLDPSNNCETNLLVICSKCHRSMHNKIMYENYMESVEVYHRDQRI